MNVQPFSPAQSVAGSTQAIVPTSASASLTFSAPSTNLNCYYIANRTNQDVAVRIGLASAGAVTATFPTVGTPGDLVVPAGSVQIFSKGYNDTIALVIAAGQTATGTVYVCAGEGQ